VSADLVNLDGLEPYADAQVLKHKVIDN
jgi:hypothetical protein